MAEPLKPGSFAIPRRPAETVEIPGFKANPAEMVEVVVQGLDMGQRIDLVQAVKSESRGDFIMALLAKTVVFVENRKPVLDEQGWRDWSSRCTEMDVAKIVDVALRLSGFADAGKT